MNVYDHPEQLPEPVAKILEQHILWINHFLEEEDYKINLSDYFDYGAHIVEEVSRFPLYNETIRVMQVDPHHDEGGPALLIAYFYDNNLNTITQYFDTTGQIIYRDGHLVF